MERTSYILEENKRGQSNPDLEVEGDVINLDNRYKYRKNVVEVKHY